MKTVPIKVFTILAIALTYGLPDKTCNRLKIGDNWYDREVLWAHLGRPYNLNIHKSSNILFFSYSKPETFLDVDFQLAYFNIDTKEYQTIAGIRGGCAVTIDQANDEIYLGGTDGIYKYNMLTKLADYYKEKGKNIWALFYRKNLFYISYPDQTLYIEIDGKFATVKEFVWFEIDHFHVDSNNDIYFANKSGLYKYDNTAMGIVVINELITVRQIVEDNDGYLYICTNFGVYIDKKFEGLKKIIDVKNIFGLTFDRDNHFIFSDEKSIIKLSYSTQSCVNGDPHW